MIKQNLNDSKKNDTINDLKDKSKSKTKLIFIIIIVVLLLALLSSFGIIVFKRIYGNAVVMTYDGITFSRNDYMMYLRLAKTSLFDENTNKLPKATLNTIVDKESNTNVDTYLRKKVEQSLKISGAVQIVAKKEKIELTDEDKNKLNEDKEKYIESLGGRNKFLKFLKDNNTTEEAYDNMAYTDMLYSIIYQNLYAEGKIYDLTDKEKESIKKEYEQNYYKARQILFIFVDPSTKEKLPDSVVEQKKLLAEAVKSQINDETDFNEYIKKYSDDAVDADPPYDMYFKAGEVLQEIEDTTKSLNIGEVSDVIKSNYAFHIIKRDPLDDSYLNKLYEQKREEKFMKVLNDQINNSVIIIEDTFTNMNIN